MIWDTKEAWHDLADFMSEISEEAFFASWMGGLEYDLWDAVQNGPRRYGQITIDETMISELRRLSTVCGGWVRFSDDPQVDEEFVPIDDWKRIYASKK